MAVRYLNNQPIPNADAAAQAMLEIQAFEQKEFGYWEDTTAEDLMISLRRYAWLLSQLDEPFPPPNFKLQPLLEVQGPVEEIEE